MKRIFLYGLRACVSWTMQSCLFSEDDVFEQSSAERDNASVAGIKELLMSSPTGWNLEYRYGEDGDWGVSNIFMKFDETNVTMASDYATMKDLIKLERRVEFAFEGLHFYDTRRWLTAEETEKGNMHGMNIQASGKSGSNEYPEEFFQRTVFEKRVYNASYNLFPIPQSVMEKNPALVQNYKW